jgi:restriction endonuclease
MSFYSCLPLVQKWLLYLEKTLQDISLTHAGYFSKDNSEKDEAIEKEINEILHDKQTMLENILG